MNKNLSRVIGTTIGTAAFAMMTGQAITAQSQAPGSAATQQSTRAAGAQQVTLTGCIQREADYRRSTGAVAGGVASTGVGVGNEFILANAMTATAASGAPATGPGAGAPSATGTAGTTSTTAYELTGSHEGEASAFVGKRVEISGMLKAADATPGGPTATVPGSRDLKLRELEISTIKETTGTCSAPTAP